ncbi:MAG: PcfJ domain-containing protein [Gammaproteobacteria bacterium]|nr:PcfJ domain-containing protein [Gammaproteobacteria bacterium]
MLLEHSIAQLNENNDLIIDTRPILDRQCKITHWQDGMRFYTHQDNRWILESIEPGLILVNDANLNLSKAPINEFLKQIPSEVLEQIKAFHYYQFSLMQLLSHYPVLLDIFEHSPILIWISVIRAKELSVPMPDLVRLLQKKRTKVIKRLFNTDSPKAIKYINKLQLRNGDSQEYHVIKNIISNDEFIVRFAHWSILPIQVIVTALKFPEIVEHYLYKRFVSTEQDIHWNIANFSKVNKLIRDIKQMVEVLEITLPNDYFHLFNSKEQLKEAHDNLVIQLNHSEKINKLSNVDFPTCPLGEDENFIQIKNSVALAYEGKEMRHCVASYVNQAKNGQDYFYQIFAPERGTLQLRLKGNKVEIMQFKLVCNQEPSDDSWFAVKNWISDKGTTG